MHSEEVGGSLITLDVLDRFSATTSNGVFFAQVVGKRTTKNRRPLPIKQCCQQDITKASLTCSQDDQMEWWNLVIEVNGLYLYFQ